MKKLVLRKTSAMLLFIMIASALFPIIAFAGGWFTNVSYNAATGTVTGSVYVSQDVYNVLDDQNAIKINITGSNSVTGVVYATYSPNPTGIADHYYYNFSTVVGSTYGSDITLGSTVTSNVYLNVGSGGGVGPGYSGGGFIGSNGDLTVGTDGKVNATSLANALKGDGTATITLTGDTVILPASALQGGKNIIIVASGASYTLPIGSMDFDALAKSLGVELADLNIIVNIKKLTGDAEKSVSDAVYLTGGKPLAGAFDFTVTAEGKGKTQEIRDFGTYVSRTITLDRTATNASTVGVVYNPETKKLSFVPATFSTVDGNTVATLKRTSNSIYTVMSLDSKSFADLNGHWSKLEVEALASKLIVEGVSADKFEPKRNITRAEFAAIVIRSLGLDDAAPTSQFSDVSTSAWYAGSVAAAAKAGIISGYADGTFKPTANITRQELAAIVVRAMKYAGKEVTLTDAQASAQLAAFTDASKLGNWAKAEVAVAVNTGIVQGLSTTKIGGTATATRAEGAAMVLRFLNNVKFIN